MSIQRDSWRRPVAKSSYWLTVPWVKIAASLLTALTIGLTLIGYGFDYGYLDVFGLSPQELQRTPFDFLLRSDKPILLCINFINNIQSKIINRPWEPIWWETWKLLLPLAALTSIVAYFLGSSGRRLLENSVQIFREIVWINRFINHPRLAKILTSSNTKDRMRGYGMPIAVVFVIMLGIFALALVIWFFCAVVVMLVIAIPLGPTQGARDMALHDVVNPATCRLLVERGGAEPMRARCVRIVRDGCEVARGRYIEQNASRVWLFSKNPWKVISVPLDRSVMEDVGSEIPPKSVSVERNC